MRDTFDSTDKKILHILQDDASVSLNDIAQHVSLSTTPCWRRIKRLEELGVISKRVALVNPDLVDRGVMAFVHIRTTYHSDEWMCRFSSVIMDMDEVTEFYRLSGEYDYMLKVLVKDIHAFDVFYKRLIREVDLHDVTSTFAMEKIKHTTVVPL